MSLKVQTRKRLEDAALAFGATRLLAGNQDTMEQADLADRALDALLDAAGRFFDARVPETAQATLYAKAVASNLVATRETEQEVKS